MLLTNWSYHVSIIEQGTIRLYYDRQLLLIQTRVKQVLQCSYTCTDHKITGIINLYPYIYKQQCVELCQINFPDKAILKREIQLWNNQSTWSPTYNFVENTLGQKLFSTLIANIMTMDGVVLNVFSFRVRKERSKLPYLWVKKLNL